MHCVIAFMITRRRMKHIILGVTSSQSLNNDQDKQMNIFDNYPEESHHPSDSSPANEQIAH